ncbi:hypothetical protein PhCBS80983_g05550 [Powellomyces hirtus]|uniref:START domain-containing protein n=1 Tax=Powellomyces hirtus TaxID=109895 RepID=A0A507DVE0_9FUNG|nr:hypothetical protein PhCBS80983_g05550 [Powellomyces hirtus]
MAAAHSSLANTTPTHAFPDLLLRAHEQYRSLSSASDWESCPYDAPDRSDDAKALRVYHRAASSTCFKIVARVPDGNNGIALKPRNFGAVLGEASCDNRDCIFDQVKVIERIDARTSLQHLRTSSSKVTSVPNDFIVITQTVATSTTFVSISTSVPPAAASPAATTAAQPCKRSKLHLLAFVVERAADFDGLRVTVLLKTEEKEGADLLAVNKIPRTILGASAILRKQGFAPYLLNFAQSIIIRNETYNHDALTYELQWEVEPPPPEEDEIGQLGESTVSIFSTGSATPAPMVEVRLDSMRWLKPGKGLRIYLESGRAEHDTDVESLVEATPDAENGLKIACVFDMDRKHEVFTMKMEVSDQAGIWINGRLLDSVDSASALTAEIRDTPMIDEQRSTPSGGISLTKEHVKMQASVTPGISLRLYEHRFITAVAKGFNLFNCLLSDTTFRHVSSQKSIAIFHKEVLDHPVGILKGVGVYAGSQGLMWDVLAVIQTAGVRKIWDANFENDTLIEHLCPTSFLVHAMNKAVWPTSARDATVVSTLITDNDSRIQSIVNSVENDDALPGVKNGTVRAHVDIAGWDIECLPHGEIRVTHIMQFNPRGWIPSSLLNAVSTQLPLAVNAVYTHVKEFGAPPYIVRCPERYRIVRKEYDHGSGTFQLAAMPRSEEHKMGTCQVLDVRIDLEKWCSGDVDIGASQPVKLLRNQTYGVSALLIRIIASQSDIELRVSKGARGEGIVVNGVSREVDEGHVDFDPDSFSRSGSNLLIGSLPISIPTPRSQSPAGTPEQSQGWESPSGRLSASAVMLNERDTTLPMSLPADDSSKGGKGAAPRTSRKASEGERLRELKHSAKSAVGKLMKINSTSNNWALVTSLRSGLTVHKRTVSTSGFPMMKGVKVIEGFSSQEVFAVIKAFGCRKIWDDLLENGRRLEYCGEGVDVSYITLQSFFPMSRRDLVAIGKDEILSPSNNGPPTIVTAASSVSETLLSSEGLSSIARETNVRGNLLLSGWLLEPIDPYTAQQHPIPSTKATFYYQADLGGSIPTSLYGFLVGNAPKHPARVEAYLKEHGVPPYVAWPGITKTDPEEEGAEIDGVQSRDIRVLRQEFDHAKNYFVTEFSIYAEDLAAKKRALHGSSTTTRPGTEPFEIELDPPLSSDEDEEEDVLLMHIILDMSRYRLGYDVTWESSQSVNGTKFGEGLDLRIELVEIPPPPTHSATHFPSSATDGQSSTAGARAVHTGSDSGAESDGRALAGDRGLTTRQSASTPSRPKSKNTVLKHSLKVYLPRHGIGRDSSVEESDITGTEFSSVIRITPATPKSGGVPGMWSAAVGGENASSLASVNGKRVEVIKYQLADSRALQRERLKKRMSRLSVSSNRSSMVSLAPPGQHLPPGPGQFVTQTTGQSTPSIFNTAGLWNRRRPGTDAAGELKHGARVSSMPVTTSTGGAKAHLGAQSGLAHSFGTSLAQRRSSSSGAVLASDHHSPSLIAGPTTRRTPPGSHRDMETPPLFKPAERPPAAAAASTTTHTRGQGFWTRLRAPPSSPTYPLSLLVVCGVLAFALGYALQLFLVDPG